MYNLVEYALSTRSIDDKSDTTKGASHERKNLDKKRISSYIK